MSLTFSHPHGQELLQWVIHPLQELFIRLFILMVLFMS